MVNDIIEEKEKAIYNLNVLTSEFISNLNDKELEIFQLLFKLLHSKDLEFTSLLNTIITNQIIFRIKDK